MATVYNVEITPYWISYDKETLKKIITEAVNKVEKTKRNIIQVSIINKQ